jgi:hypothetical protein
MTHTTTTLPGGVIEHDGMLWKPKRSAAATAEEFIAARTLFIELHREGRWNSWVLEDRQSELERATEVMDQWKRAEPGYRSVHASVRRCDMHVPCICTRGGSSEGTAKV